MKILPLPLPNVRANPDWKEEAADWNAIELLPGTPESRAPRGASTNRLIIVSNRLPVTVTSRDGQAVVERSVGGLATGLRSVHERTEGVWIGWPGPLTEVSPVAERAVLQEFAERRLMPVVLSADEAHEFYEQFSNAVLWPLFHDRLDRLPLRLRGWERYEAVNVRYADAIAEQWQPGDLVWVHDYQLLRVPALLRARIPQARIAFFLHIPFPSPDIFGTLPTCDRLLEGMLGADLIGFHTERYRANFAATLSRVVGVAPRIRDGIEYQGRDLSLGVFPLGVDAAAFARRAMSRDVTLMRLELRTAGRQLLVGVDRLDYTKGIPRRLLAFERLLQLNAALRERVCLIQVAVPSREGVGAYRRCRREVEALVGRINGSYGTPTWTPIHYLHHRVTEDTLVALYRAAHVMLVTPLKDGMNLVAKEFVASRTDEDGVLLLSQFAGAAEELGDAVLVNPFDVDGVANAMLRALKMDGVERRGRMRRLRAQVFAYDVEWWAQSFMNAWTGQGQTRDDALSSSPALVRADSHHWILRAPAGSSRAVASAATSVP